MMTYIVVDKQVHILTIFRRSHHEPPDISGSVAQASVYPLRKNLPPESAASPELIS